MIDVYICTYNPKYDYLKRTVEAILKQDLDKAEWDFAIIDNNSKSPVADIDFVKENNIKVFVEKEQGLTAARRCATQHSTKPVLVFVDDDNILESNYLSEVKKIFKDETIGIISGTIIPEYEVKPEKWFYDIEAMVAVRRLTGTELILNDKKTYNETFPIGAGMTVRRELIDDYYTNHLNAENHIEGRKAEDLSSAEDIDLDFFALYKGYKIGVAPALKMLHIIPKNRVTIEYILKLSKGSFHSTYLVNKKWSKIFNHSVFEQYEMPYTKLIIRRYIHKLLSFSKAHRIRYDHFNNMLEHKTYTK